MRSSVACLSFLILNALLCASQSTVSAPLTKVEKLRKRLLARAHHAPAIVPASAPQGRGRPRRGRPQLRQDRSHHSHRTHHHKHLAHGGHGGARGYVQYGRSHPYAAAAAAQGTDRASRHLYATATATDTGDETVAGSAAWQPLRIVTYILDEYNAGVAEADLAYLRTALLPAAVRYWRDALRVVRTPAGTNLTFARECLQRAASPDGTVYCMLDHEAYCAQYPYECTGSRQFLGEQCGPDLTVPASHLGPFSLWECSVQSGCTGERKRPGGAGVPEADFVLYVTASQNSVCSGGSVLAYANTCNTDQYDRPTFGFANFCPGAINRSVAQWEDQYATAVHEIGHALGFSEWHLALFRDPDRGGAPRTARDSFGDPAWTYAPCPDGVNRWRYNTSEDTVRIEPLTPGSGAGSGGTPPAQAGDSAAERLLAMQRRHVSRVVTPRVAAAVQDHFGCPSLAGAELENHDFNAGQYSCQGPMEECTDYGQASCLLHAADQQCEWVRAGCIGSHWEERLFYNNMMSPNSNLATFAPRLLLALLEDSGWYKANYVKTTSPSWGYKAGCDFVHQPCLSPGTKGAGQDARSPATVESPQTRFPRHFCNEARFGCSANRLFKARCELRDLTPYFGAGGVDTVYQYWVDAPNYGSPFELMDFCPIYWGGGPQNDCRIASNGDQANLANYGGERFGATSRCFEADVNFVVQDPTTGRSSQLASPSMVPRCYPHRCNGTVLEVLVSTPTGDEWLVCEEGGSATPHSGARRSGAVHCPTEVVKDLCRPDLAACPNQCSRRGHCVQAKVSGVQVGRCVCNEGYRGHDCSTATLPHACSGHGTQHLVGTGLLAELECTCDLGWSGVDCSCATAIDSGAADAMPAPAPFRPPIPESSMNCWEGEYWPWCSGTYESDAGKTYEAPSTCRYDCCEGQGGHSSCWLPEYGLTYNNCCGVHTTAQFRSCTFPPTPPDGPGQSGGLLDVGMCAPGERVNQTSSNGATTCVACEAGKYQPAVGTSTNCLDCAAGHFAGVGWPSCDACPPGKWLNASYVARGVTRCVGALCTPGTFAAPAQAAAIDCAPCPAGKFAASAGSAACRPTTQCRANEWEAAAPSSAVDRRCIRMTTCDIAGGEYESTPATTTSDRACARVSDAIASIDNRIEALTQSVAAAASEPYALLFPHLLQINATLTTLLRDWDARVDTGRDIAAAHAALLSRMSILEATACRATPATASADAGDGNGGDSDVQSMCVSSATGERMSTMLLPFSADAAQMGAHIGRAAAEGGRLCLCTGASASASATSGAGASAQTTSAPAPAATPVHTMPTAGSFRIAAFNVKVFGKSFMANKPAAVATLVRVIRRYDIIMLQEVRDKSETAIFELLALVNDGVPADARYAMHLSERLGRTAQKEQLAFFHRVTRLSVAATMTYADPDDRWERPPVVVWWNLVGTAQRVLATVGVHVDPDTAVREIDALSDVMDDVASSTPTSFPRMPMTVDAGILLMGDLNADCAYVRASQWECIRDTSCNATQMRLWNQNKFRWLIDDDADTTTSSTTDCAYDRFVWATQWPHNISDAGVYDFGKALGLPPAHVVDVSDHYPIELTLSLPVLPS